MADLELRFPQPSLRREYCIVYCWPRKRSKFNTWSMISNECISFLHHHKVKKWSRQTIRSWGLSAQQIWFYDLNSGVLRLAPLFIFCNSNLTCYPLYTRKGGNSNPQLRAALRSWESQAIQKHQERLVCLFIHLTTNESSPLPTCWRCRPHGTFGLAIGKEINQTMGSNVTQTMWLWRWNKCWEGNGRLFGLIREVKECSAG